MINAKKLRESIRILERKLGVLQDNGYSCCKITMSQCHALVEIGRANNISLNQLAELLNLENSTMSRTVNNLVSNDLAKRDIDPEDRRYVTISLTDKGYKIFEEIENDMSNYFKKIYDEIPEGKRQQVLDSIDILIEAINKSELNN
ncbi:MarR family transcriptional regulator [Clostridium sp. YIM B02506]|uniref:MarR family winged helix-turn-helix transcriptional regulator n=1 Tax=Clostridium sp. YIM B02506 TaxID=2910680 RepID=UPI001EEDE03A|nr:MarR family transcriptional regulator [Clostridium sp. YIM B02506]